jgi:hypothetical protein
MEVLAASIVGFIGNFLVQLLKSSSDKTAESAGEEIGQAVGQGSWSLAKRIWSKLRPGLEMRPGGIEAAKEATETPEDADASAALRQAIKKILEHDQSLASQLEGMMEEAEALQVVSVSGKGAVGIGGDVRAKSGGVAVGRDIKGDVNTRPGDRSV